MVDQVPVSPRAACIEYAIRDVVVPATVLERQGHEIIKLNIGDPLAYPGLPTPTHMVQAFQQALVDQQNGYSPSYGLDSVREAIAADETAKGWNCTRDDVYVTTGVTEALHIMFASFLSAGETVLTPGPHYPPYMAYPQLFGGQTVEYRLRPDADWSIDFDDVEAKMNDSVRLLVLINPNNPTGNIAGPEEIDRLLDIASRWPMCTIVADEIYDDLDFTGQQESCAARSNGVPVITLNGVSKNYYAPGWRIGYMAWHDRDGRLMDVRDGAERLLRSRLCASSPAQLGYLAGLTSSQDWKADYHQGLLERRDLCVERIAGIEGLEVEVPGGSFYMFVRLSDAKWAGDDKKFVLDLLHEEHVLLVHGSGFSKEFGSGHFRLVFLPDLDVLNEAFDRIDRFLNRHRT